jgi:hypothetical protein
MLFKSLCSFGVLASTLWVSVSHAQGPEPLVCLPWNDDDVDTPGGNRKHITVNKEKCDFAYTIDKKSDNTWIKDRYKVAVLFGDQSQKLSDLGITKVTVTVGSKSVDHTINDMGDWNYFVFYFYEANFPGLLSNETPIFVTIPGYEGRTWYFRYKKTISTYKGFDKVPFAWFPVALFSTNFKSNENGVSLAPMPIGLAAGIKINVNKDYYFGFSAIASWLIAPEKKADNAEKSSGNYNVSQMSFGGLVDFSNFLYAGYAYGKNFKSGNSDQGHLFVVGVAPGALQLFQGKP